MRLRRQNRFQNKHEIARLQAAYRKGRRFSFGIDSGPGSPAKMRWIANGIFTMSLKDEVDVNNHIQQHNVSQAAVVARGQDLLKTLLLLSGGALAVCASFFSAKVELPTSTVAPVQFAWAFLTAAIILFGASLTLLLGRDYLLGEIVSRQLVEWKKGQPDPNEANLSMKWDYSIWGAGLLGLMCFIFGMSCFTFAAWRFLDDQIPLIR